MTIVKYFVMDSPVGPLTLLSRDSGLESISFGNREPEGAVRDLDANQAFITQLNEYFSGSRRAFLLPLAPRGTAFQRLVWEQLLQIPYGETQSYGSIARAIGKPGAARAIGMANNRNPIPIIVPCHRVIGTNGSLTGYAGGLDVKARLLALEGALLTKEHAATSHPRGGTTFAHAAL